LSAHRLAGNEVFQLGHGILDRILECLREISDKVFQSFSPRSQRFDHSPEQFFRAAGEIVPRAVAGTVARARYLAPLAVKKSALSVFMERHVAKLRSLVC
jgi:hypothetical protein